MFYRQKNVWWRGFFHIWILLIQCQVLLSMDSLPGLVAPSVTFHDSSSRLVGNRVTKSISSLSSRNHHHLKAAGHCIAHVVAWFARQQSKGDLEVPWFHRQRLCSRLKNHASPSTKVDSLIIRILTRREKIVHPPCMGNPFKLHANLCHSPYAWYFIVAICQPYFV